jgi:hypothetical protein
MLKNHKDKILDEDEDSHETTQDNILESAAKEDVNKIKIALESHFLLQM